MHEYYHKFYINLADYEGDHQLAVKNESYTQIVDATNLKQGQK